MNTHHTVYDTAIVAVGVSELEGLAKHIIKLELPRPVLASDLSDSAYYFHVLSDIRVSRLLAFACLQLRCLVVSEDRTSTATHGQDGHHDHCR